MAIGAICVSAGAEGVAHLSKDYPYWRGLKEESPGPFLCVSPAATDVTVVCDRWPDGSDLKQFGLDAIRLSGAEGEQEQCIAIWRWVRRWTMYTDGNPPTEKFLEKKKGYIDDPIKVLNVYGTHWCDGLSRAVECVWRALGHRAEKFYRGGHTMVNCYYTDYDGVKRWHLFDVSEGGFMYDRARRRLLTPTEMNTDYYNWMAYWVHCAHLEMPTHRMELAFRVGEKLERIWGNQGKPYQDNVRRDHQTVPEWERGPYEVDYGNGCWSYAPDLSKPDWVKGLAEPPVNMAPGKLVPARAGKPGVRAEERPRHHPASSVCRRRRKLEEALGVSARGNRQEEGDCPYLRQVRGDGEGDASCWFQLAFRALCLPTQTGAACRAEAWRRSNRRYPLRDLGAAQHLFSASVAAR
jgi:hypothetical protein